MAICRSRFRAHKQLNSVEDGIGRTRRSGPVAVLVEKRSMSARQLSRAGLTPRPQIQHIFVTGPSIPVLTEIGSKRGSRQSPEPSSQILDPACRDPLWAAPLLTQGATQSALPWPFGVPAANRLLPFRRWSGTGKGRRSALGWPGGHLEA
jgi:hypothetical protein